MQTIETQADAEALAVLNHHGRPSLPSEGSTVFPVVGAGQVELAGNCVSRCGSAYGLSFDVSWSRYGYTGGVMDYAEVEKLRDWLTAWLAFAAEKTGRVAPVEVDAGA